VNPVYGKRPGNREFTQSRDATVDLVYIYKLKKQPKKSCYTVVVRGCKNRTCRLAARSVVQYSTVQYTTVKYIYIYILWLMFGRSESESCMRQNACYPVKRGFTQLRGATVDLSLQRRTCPSKFGLPVNNTVKKEELTRIIRNCLLVSMDLATKNNPIRVPGIWKDTGIKRIGIEWAQRIYVVERRIGLFKRSETEMLTDGSGRAWRD
jgi:hypothetical protein